MLGYALGCIRLSYDDFCRLLPEEFEEICRAYYAQRDAELKGEWERMRLLATISIQPHVKGRLTPEKLLPFPWEKSQAVNAEKALSREEAKARFDALLKRTGNQQ